MLNLSLTGWQKNNREPESIKLPTKNVLSYKKDEIIEAVEWCGKKSREMNLFDQKKAKHFGIEDFQRLQYEL